MPKRNLLFVYLLLVSSGMPMAVIAGANDQPDETDQADQTIRADQDDEADDEFCPDPAIAVQQKETSIFDFLYKPQKKITTGLEWLSKRIDIFFANEKIYDESTGSYARLSGSTILRESGQQNFLGDFHLRIELPHTKKKLKLLIETDADKNFENRPGQQGQATPNQVLNETSYYAGVEQQLTEKGLWDIRTSTGIKVHSPLDPFIRLRMTREADFAPWKLRFTETLFYFHSSGTGHNTSLELDRPISTTDLFRMSTSATWWDNTDHYDLSQSFTFFKQLSDRRALSYGISVFGTNKPAVQADIYLLDIRYRQLLYKDWLFAEINPQVLYQKTGNFEPEHSLTLKIEMIFGEVHFWQ